MQPTNSASQSCAQEYTSTTLARQHDGLALQQFFVCWCARSTARWSHACPGTPPLFAQPAAGIGSGGRSAANQLGVALVSTRAHEYDDHSTARRPRLAAGY
eukprot:4771523-Prymnesium_polylepis.1